MTDETNLTEMDDSWMNMDDPSAGYEPPQLVESGKEVRLKIFKTKPASPEKVAEGKRYINVALEVLGEVNAQPVNHILSMVNSTDEPRTANFKRGMFKDFYEAFNITEAMRNPTNHEGWVGMEANAVLTVEPGQGNYGPSNRVKQWLR